MSGEKFPADRMEYRLLKFTLEVGFVCTLLFGLAGINSVIVALLNPDGSFRYPVAAAVIFGCFWSSLSLLGLFLILSYYRHRLLVSPENVRVIGSFTTREVQPANVTRAVWKSFVNGGTLVLYDKTTRVRIQFGNYSLKDRLELIHFFRTALALDSQEGWERFEARCLPKQLDYEELKSQLHGHVRFALKAWAAAIPVMYAILIWQKLNGGLPNGNWVFVAILPLAVAGVTVGFLWFLVRGSLESARGGRQNAS